MNNVRFSILVLGDCSYKDYCKTGDDFRKKFLEMVAKEIYLLVECNIGHLEKPPTSALYKICKVLIPTKIVGTPALQILQALNLEFLEVPYRLRKRRQPLGTRGSRGICKSIATKNKDMHIIYFVIMSVFFHFIGTCIILHKLN